LSAWLPVAAKLPSPPDRKKQRKLETAAGNGRRFLLQRRRFQLLLRVFIHFCTLITQKPVDVIISVL
jgi:hypothetical protein